MHHRCGVTLHTCQRIDRSHGAFQEAILEKDREEGSEKWGEEKGVGRRFFAPRVLVSSKLTFYEAGSREKLGVTRDGCTPVGVSGFGGVLKHRTKEAKKRNHVVFFFFTTWFRECFDRPSRRDETKPNLDYSKRRASSTLHPRKNHIGHEDGAQRAYRPRAGDLL